MSRKGKAVVDMKTGKGEDVREKMHFTPTQDKIPIPSVRSNMPPRPQQKMVAQEGSFRFKTHSIKTASRVKNTVKLNEPNDPPTASKKLVILATGARNNMPSGSRQKTVVQEGSSVDFLTCPWCSSSISENLKAMSPSSSLLSAINRVIINPIYEDPPEDVRPVLPPEKASDEYKLPENASDDSKIKQDMEAYALKLLNEGSVEELMTLRGIGKTRIQYITRLRSQCEKPFKNLHDLQNIGMSDLQIQSMMKAFSNKLFDTLNS